MNKTKKNGFLKAACIMLSVTMLATCVVAGTMAKYTTSSGNIEAKAQIASWKITVNEENLKDLTTTDLDFKILDTDGADPYTEEHVANDKIAPGTWGYATVKIKNAGEVNADITANFTKGDDLPAGMTVVALTGEPKSPEDVDDGKESVTAKNVAPESTADMVIAFKWEFGDPKNNDTDTTKGEAAASGSADLSLGTLKITADQVD